MENPYKILCFGDSLTAGYAPMFEQQFKETFPDIETMIINAGIAGETSRDGLQRLPLLMEDRPDVVIIGFGMNDLAKCVTTVELANNLCQIVSAFERIGATRVLLLTINPVNGVAGDSLNDRIDTYNQVIKDIAHEKRIRLIDINTLWKREIHPLAKGMKDWGHPNELGKELYCKALLRVVPRRSFIILWQYNGNPCECNYVCPYCSYNPKTQKGHYFKGTIESWRKAFKCTFGNQHLVFYLAHGEPMIGEKFFDVLDMIGDEPNWEVRMTSNISVHLDRLVKTKVAGEGRLSVNASFHPTMTKLDDFVRRALFLRRNSIEVPIIYVMWPPFFRRFEQDFKVFNKHRFLVYAFRFSGFFKGKRYPQAYTEEERQFMAKYMDDAMIKYMLSWESSFGKLTWSGVDFMIINNEGNVGYTDAFHEGNYTDACQSGKYCLGNIFQGTFRFLSEPRPFPGRDVSEHTVDGVANFLELNYRQLDEGNNVMSFAKQGGVYHTPDGVFYKNMHTDFNNSHVRAKYRFPPRNLVDCYHVLRCKDLDLIQRWRQIGQFILPEYVFRLTPLNWRSALGRRLPAARYIYRYLRQGMSKLKAHLS